jgi:hypothetical protein
MPKSVEIIIGDRYYKTILSASVAEGISQSALLYRLRGDYYERHGIVVQYVDPQRQQARLQRLEMRYRYKAMTRQGAEGDGDYPAIMHVNGKPHRIVNDRIYPINEDDKS